jgi:serine/threonine protein kinase
VLLTDFGLARTIDEASLTCSGVIAGTPQYMAPEQARGEMVDFRSDLFSLGSVLYALCTGHSPFRAETTMGVLHRICKESPRPIQELNPEIPLWLSAIITRLHAKNPAKRYASAAEVAEILQRQLARLQSPSGTLSLSWSEAGLSARVWMAHHARRIGLWSGAIAVLLALSVILINQFWPTSETGRQTNPPGSATTQRAAGRASDAGDDAQSEQAWRQSVSELQSQADRIDDELHNSPSSPDRVTAELTQLRERLAKIEGSAP